MSIRRKSSGVAAKVRTKSELSTMSEPRRRMAQSFGVKTNAELNARLAVQVAAKKRKVDAQKKAYKKERPKKKKTGSGGYSSRW